MPPTFTSAAPQLQQRRLGVIHLVFFTVAASAPLTVLGGGVTATYAATGNAGTPLSFVLLALALALFAVGYAAMSRHVANAGAFYSYLAKGLGRVWAVAGAFVALISYNAIQIGLYGLFGVAANLFFSSVFGIDITWWLLSAVALILVALLGVLRVDLNANVLAVLLVLEIVIVVLYDIGAFGHPAGGTVAPHGMDPTALFVPGVGAVLALGIAAFIGFESGAIYSEECRNPRITVARATYIAVAFTGVFYAISAWAMLTNVGEAGIQAAAVNGPGVVFGALADHWGPIVSDVGSALFMTSVFAALLSFHNSVARYLFALGRERVLPTGLARIGARSGGPVAGSVVQTVLAVVVVALFVIGGADPLTQLFTWLSGMAAVGVVLLMAGTSASVVAYFRNHRSSATAWQRSIAPIAATVVLLVIVGIIVVNFDALLGGDTTSPLRWVLPGLVALAAIGGAVWASVLRGTRPEIYDGIGRTALAPKEDDAPPSLDLPSMPH